ncbi:hypothetical protein [Acidovorax cavernicola]|uniref:hypothetical protein n=1 Tax=Acidovorax cavernicola TaxID=1675792 RepID=UPI0011C3736B|nr:hypothetical protein [Acidovorax cavernicola]
MEPESLSDESIEAQCFPGTIPPAGPASLQYRIADGRPDGAGNYFFNAVGGIEILLPESNGQPTDDAVNLLSLVAEHFEDTRKAAIRLAKSFTRDAGNWSLDSIDMGAAAVADRCDFQIHLSLTPDDGSDSYGYTDFVACFRRHERPEREPFSAFKLVIEFL